jgi:hypothetical protein
MTAHKRCFVILACLTLALYVWGALTAPVVLWSDSQADMEWASTGVGIFRPVPAPPPGGALGHQPKPAYLLFLRVAMRTFPGLGDARSVIVLQSVLAWAGFVIAAWRLTSRGSLAAGLILLAFPLFFLRARDASSAVMPEALSVALLLPLVAVTVEPVRRVWAGLLQGLAAAILFFVRPNCGGVMLVLGLIGLSLARRPRLLAAFAGGFVVFAVPFGIAAQPAPPGDPFHGLGYQILEGSADYYWVPSIGTWPTANTPKEMAHAELDRATSNWRRTLAGSGIDRRRELVWRSLRGLFGVEYYDATWSRLYRRFSLASRQLSPFLILGALALVFAVPWATKTRTVKILAIVLLAVLIGQSLALGANPRYALPFLPVLLLLAASVSPSLLARRARVVAAFTFVVLAGLLFSQRQVLDWEWGRIESAGVTLRQEIPQGSLPAKEPATLHLRIARPVPSGAHFAIVIEDRVLFASEQNSAPERPLVTLSLPEWLLERSSRQSVEMELKSYGSYDSRSFFLFPVIPLPWAHPAHREGNAELSPTTGVSSGALDWWAHKGFP